MAVSLSITIAQNSQNKANNTSNITVNVIASWTYGSNNRMSPAPSGWVKIDGTQYNFSNTFNDDVTSSGSKTLYSKTVNVEHGADGKKTVSCNASFATGVSSGTITASASKALTQIPREASITAAPNFNDEANPTISYSNPAGNSVDKLEACISLDGSAADVAYRSISKTGTSYTFNLTTAERNVLRNATSSNSRAVRFYVQTTIGDNVYRDSLSKTFSIVNGNPTISPAVVDANATTLALTGDQNKLVKYYSNAKVTTGAAAIKGATLSSQKVVNGSKSLTGNGTINAIESGKFVFTATDSRGNTSSKTVDKTIVNYVKLSCNIAPGYPTADGEFSFTVTGNYFNGSFGSAANALEVYYRYKLSGGAYGSWATMTASKSGNSYTATANLTGLDYQADYVFQAYAKDKLATVYTAEKAIKSLPVFDWDADSFAFHTPLFLDNTKQIWHKDTSGNNVLMMSINASNQAFFGYGMYDAGLGSTYFDGNTVNIRSKNNISNTAGGTIGGNKAWTNSSDSRLKEDVEDLPSVFCELWLELAPKVFRWNELNNGDATLHFGLIAQDVIAAFKKHGLNYKDYGFVSTVPVNGVDYYAITYEYYNMITAQVLKNTVAEVATIKDELKQIRNKLSI